MNVVTLDVETVVVDWTPPPDDPKKFAPLGHHRPVVICWLTYDGDIGQWQMHRHEIHSPDDERAALLDLGQWLERSERLVTFNGRGFDVPLLGLRAMANWVSWPWWKESRWKRYESRGLLYHWDMMDLLTLQGGARGLSQDSACKALGLPGKTDVDGSDVASLWAAGRYAEVVRYCESDVWQLHAIYLHYIGMVSGLGTKMVQDHYKRFMEFVGFGK